MDKILDNILNKVINEDRLIFLIGSVASISDKNHRLMQLHMYNLYLNLYLGTVTILDPETGFYVYKIKINYRLPERVYDIYGLNFQFKDLYLKLIDVLGSHVPLDKNNNELILKCDYNADVPTTLSGLDSTIFDLQRSLESYTFDEFKSNFYEFVV